MRRRRTLIAAITVGLAVVGPATALLATDIYLHTKFNRSAGFNLWGYRGPIAGRKGPHEYRIAMLGGSTTFGYGVAPELAIPALLETALAAHGPTVFHVVNLGYNNEGAYSFKFTLDDYAYLGYDLALLYSGYNDIMGGPTAPGGPDRPNTNVFRHESPVFRLTGYLPIFPIIFREKAQVMLSGGTPTAGSDASGRTVFRPGLAARTTADVLQTTAQVSESLDRQLERIVKEPPHEVGDTRAGGCKYPWREYCQSVFEAVQWALAHNKQVLVVTEPYEAGDLHPRHIDQQHEMAAMLQRQFGSDERVGYINLGNTVDIRDPMLSFDGMHLTATGNERIAQALVEPVVAMAAHSRGPAPKGGP